MASEHEHEPGADSSKTIINEHPLPWAVSWETTRYVCGPVVVSRPGIRVVRTHLSVLVLQGAEGVNPSLGAMDVVASSRLETFECPSQVF